ncbi:RNA polymerase sigma factor [Enhygromyxa salina]|uniref:ECF RNA polymerase sigma factor SigR n=1 Tax=Enhygromyxa salina TaxID=215803 RepID=A0A2S9YFM9_9BACT|nr:sigma-70 family RNA polymerase sigma factor [Enhygromyxa salina]PRQ03918.1 ECF RNA polymerase sigma factor SigR [Enhygromyxa salina]
MTTNDDPSSPLTQLVAMRDEFLAFVLGRVGDRALAEDILQDAFAKSVERLSSLRQPESATAWFYRVLRNASAESYRRRDAKQRALDTVAAQTAVAFEQLALDEVAVGCRCVGRVADSLTPNYATALTRIEVDGLSVKDFAAEQGITPNNAAVRVHRARAALARELAECCGACASLGCGDCTCEG